MANYSHAEMPTYTTTVNPSKKNNDLRTRPHETRPVRQAYDIFDFTVRKSILTIKTKSYRLRAGHVKGGLQLL
jgi:hypothetical protein